MDTQEGGAAIRILVVDENPIRRAVIEEGLKEAGYANVVALATTVRLVDHIYRLDPDVILMDISLPGISGVDALQVLAENRATAHIPVIAISANALPRDIENGLAAGFFRYLTKPIRVNELLETLDVALQFARTGAGKRATDGASTPGSP